MEKKTPLYDEHVAAGARMVPFAGYLMPIQYSGILDEHRAVRSGMGMFDLSHMGEFRISGDDALSAVDALVTNNVCGLEVGQILYTPMCYPSGYIVDDLLVYRFEDGLMLVVNASNIEKDLAWIRGHLSDGARVEDVSDAAALIAVQGPRASSFLQQFTPVNLDEITYYHFVEAPFAGVAAIISRTGYTGEDGFELYVDAGEAQAVWRELRARDEAEGLKLVGLGARDTLRMEAGLALYGNDIDDTTTPLEAGLGWTVKFGERDFIGREALETQKQQGVPRRLMAVDVLDRAIPRAHGELFAGEERIGEMTSGTFSPTFGHGVGLGYVAAGAARPGTGVEVEVRGQRHPARLVRKPMYRREGG